VTAQPKEFSVRTPLFRRAAVLAGALALTAITAGCTAVPDAARTINVDTHPNPGEDVVALSEGSTDADINRAVENAVAQLPELVKAAMDQVGIPGLAVAVVHRGEIIYSDGFGVKVMGIDSPAEEKVDAQTVFQIASLSKSISATAVAKAITEGVISWTTAVITDLPDFALSDPYVTKNATVGDYFSHRSGLAQGAGDDLEDIGYDRGYILDHLDLQPLSPFRSNYQYSNYGLTVGAEAAAAALGMNWEDAVDQLVFKPIGMTSSSSRYADFLAQDNRATIHALVDGQFVPRYDRDPDPQSPAGGVSSNVIDLGKWMNVILAQGRLNGQDYIDPVALTAATTGEMISGHPVSPTARTSMYGFGFNVGTQVGGRTSISHSGAFVLGAATNFQLVPSLDLGIVTLTNAGPQGVPEAVNAEFLDLVQYGLITRDWVTDYNAALGAFYKPVGDLVGEAAPSGATSASSPSTYVGNYTNEYFGTLTISEQDGGLVAALGPDGAYTVGLDPWTGDTFSFVPTGENAPTGSLSSATFSRTGDSISSLTLEFFDHQGLGTWERTTQ